MNITFKQCNSTNYKASRAYDIKYIVIHYTANNGDTAKGNASYFANNANLEASAHYFADENEVYQSVKESDTAWHCGGKTYKHATCRNHNSLGVELCSRKDSAGKYYFKDATVNNAVTLVKSLMAKYSVPIANVIRHYDVTGKNCPAPFVEDESKWKAFKQKLIGDDEVTLGEAKAIVKKKAGLSDETIAFLSAYKYEKDLMIKLAEAMQ